MSSERAVANQIEIARQVDGFLDKYLPAIAGEARICRETLRNLVANGYELVYDNYNALVFGYGPTERPSDAILSLVIYPKWVTLCFLQGVTLADPHRLLQGQGNQVRTIRLAGPGDLDRAEVRDLIDRAGARVSDLFATAPPLATVIRSVSAKQRPRRPSVGAG